MQKVSVGKSLIVIENFKHTKNKAFISTVLWELYCLKKSIEPYSFDGKLALNDLIDYAETTFYEITNEQIEDYNLILNALMLNEVVPFELYKTRVKWNDYKVGIYLNFPNDEGES
jgi:hypothetical protein